MVMLGGLLAGTKAQDIVRKFAARPQECTEEEKEKAERIKLTADQQRRGGESLACTHTHALLTHLIKSTDC